MTNSDYVFKQTKGRYQSTVLELWRMSKPKFLKEYSALINDDFNKCSNKTHEIILSEEDIVRLNHLLDYASLCICFELDASDDMAKSLNMSKHSFWQKWNLERDILGTIKGKLNDWKN